MKTTLLMTLGLLISLSSYSQNLIDNAQDPIGMKLISGGTYVIEVGPGLIKDVRVDDFWMSNEISNKEFRKFYEDISNNPNDTITWVDFSKMKTNKRTSDDKMIKPVVVKEAYKDIFNKIIDLSVSNSIPNKENYFTDSKYDNYPVIGVTWKGARYFCIWRTNQEFEKLKKQGNPMIMDYRLPTEYEWIYALTFNDSKSIVDIKELHQIDKGEKNKIGLINLTGNVAEWTSSSDSKDNLEYKVVKGSSWKSDSKDTQRQLVLPDKGTDCIGFRIVRSDIKNK
jgi:formylglycine-generating enzyme required for sulfatase activity